MYLIGEINKINYFLIIKNLELKIRKMIIDQ